MFRLPTPRLFSGLKSALRPAMPRFKVSAFWLLVLAWIFLLVWIWWKGPAWSLYEEHWLKPLANRWLATAIWGLIALIWLTVRVMKRLQQLERQQKQQREETQDPVSVELNAQQRYLDRWLLRLQRHLDSRRYLWQLPWYMVVGPAGSGKTALLREGFPADIIYTPEAVRGTGQRLYITPHVGKQAVIFDPDGVLCEQQDTEVLPRRLWEHWLGWLVQKRARQPLNGLILTLDLPDLLTADKHRREHLVQLLRSRLQDVRQHLHCQLPVYVVLTRLDLLTGFAALFHSLDKQGRDAILGVTFTRHAHENDDWRVELKAFWQTWGEQLNNALPDLMLAQNHDRSALFSFVRQMQGCHDVLAVLLGSLLDGENMDVMLRGIYLTSSLQRGQMDDIFMQSAARQYLLGSSPLAAWPLVDTRPYFTRCLFPLALLAEPNLSGENSVWLGNARRRMMGVAACSAVLIVLAAGGWHHYYNTNWNAGVRVLEQARAFMSVPPPQGVDDYGNLQLPLLNPVRDATLAYGDWGDRSRFADLGLYQGRNIGPYVEQTYLQLLEQRYLTSLSNGLIKDLAAAPQGSEQKLAVLRVVRMLEDKSGRNDAVVKQYMAKRWSEQFHGQRDIQAQLMSHLDYALKHTDWHAAREQGDNDAISRWAPYDKPVADAQNELSKLPVYQRVYQSLKTRAQGVLPADLNLRDQVGPTFELVFVSGDDNKLVVPQLLTRHGLQGYFVKQRDALVELTAMDSWVLNITRSVKYSDADRAEIQRQLAGFCEGTELLAAMISHEWDKFWPQDNHARTEMLDWFNTRTGNILRQQMSFAETDLPLLYRTERALQLICDKLQQVDLKRAPRVENLLYFVQNTRKRLEPHPGGREDTQVNTTVRTLVYAPEGVPATAEVVPPLPDLPDMKVEVHHCATVNGVAGTPPGNRLKSFAAGVVCTVVVAAALWWWQVYPVQQQLAQVRDTAQGAATAWLAFPDLNSYGQRLQQLPDAPPLQPLETGMQMMRLADSRWPESLQQQQATAQWNTTLKARAQNSPQMKGWQQTRQDLRTFAELLVQREQAKEGFTLSYIKTVVYQAERTLNQETPLESLLTQYQDAQAKGQTTGVLEKQINERLDGVLSRWLLLKNNISPATVAGSREPASQVKEK